MRQGIEFLCKLQGSRLPRRKRQALGGAQARIKLTHQQNAPWKGNQRSCSQRALVLQAPLNIPQGQGPCHQEPPLIPCVFEECGGPRLGESIRAHFNGEADRSRRTGVVRLHDHEIEQPRRGPNHFNGFCALATRNDTACCRPGAHAVSDDALLASVHGRGV